MIKIDEATCTGCELCVNFCPETCLDMVDGTAALVRPEDCDDCKTCVEVCLIEAITIE